jgi:hypothetical protein
MGMACRSHGKERNAYMILVGKPEGKSHKEGLDIGDRTIIKWISEK